MITVFTGPNAPATARRAIFSSATAFRHQWLDVEIDPLAKFLRSRVVDSPAAGCPPCSSRMEPCWRPPKNFLQVGPGISGDTQLHAAITTMYWRTELATRAGLPTRPSRDQYDLLVLGGGRRV